MRKMGNPTFKLVSPPPQKLVSSLPQEQLLVTYANAWGNNSFIINTCFWPLGMIQINLPVHLLLDSIPLRVCQCCIVSSLASAVAASFPISAFLLCACCLSVGWKSIWITPATTRMTGMNWLSREQHVFLLWPFSCLSASVQISLPYRRMDCVTDTRSCHLLAVGLLCLP